ncbi:hypothetical protein BCR37DRAFT_388049 [Protomyces lactucae-debilis]|uniref:Uncharacterized protein n=1 Tax=Protomyces lactucae-debilis TaxID=2754530 RepID=A0A1Y2FDW1_PROLT|nr:uncharacterized protein BCR37DRAFT_388049 [Protomyces lactucae-debilis]ORY81035.1 hypothetical protein BCR37DRAFT_388049 [Protomyces lactucae-debilis]
MRQCVMRANAKNHEFGHQTLLYFWSRPPDLYSQELRLLMSSEVKLSSKQAAALFHFLCQEEAFLEFSSLKIPGRIAALGPPFLPNAKFPNCDASPLLEKCIRHFVLTDTLPGFCKVQDDSNFWGGQVQGILERMAESSLSDSYDKGKVSKRKTLGMAVSVFLSNIARGLYGKVPTNAEMAVAQAEQGRPPTDPSSQGKSFDAESLTEAWQAWKRDMVHEDHLESLLVLIREARPCEQWPIQHYPAALYVKLTIASLLHYIFVASPDGSEILSIVSRLHAKLPYWSIRQALKMPYATAMIQGLSKVFLAKSMFGGSNLMQTLISYILGGDQTRLEKAIAQIEKSGIHAEYKAQILKFVHETGRETQASMRDESVATGKSIVAIIVKTINMPFEEHEVLLKYLELQLARRDRVELIQILTGDETLTSLVRQFLDIFFGIISDLHKAVDLPTGLGAAQTFIGALITCSEKQGATIFDFVDLVDRFECEFLRFGTQILNNSESLTIGYTKWYDHCLSAYRGEPVLDLQSAVAKMTEVEQKQIIAQLDAYQQYLSDKQAVSQRNLSSMLKYREKKSAVKPCSLGFGVWLGILRDVQQDAKVTPKQPQGSFDKSVRPDMQTSKNTILPVFALGLGANK